MNTLPGCTATESSPSENVSPRVAVARRSASSPSGPYVPRVTSIAVSKRFATRPAPRSPSTRTAATEPSNSSRPTCAPFSASKKVSRPPTLNAGSFTLARSSASTPRATSYTPRVTVPSNRRPPIVALTPSWLSTTSRTSSRAMFTPSRPARNAISVAPTVSANGTTSTCTSVPVNPSSSRHVSARAPP